VHTSNIAPGTNVAENWEEMTQVQELQGNACPVGGCFFRRLGRIIGAASVVATLVAGSALAEDSNVHGTVRVLHHAEGDGDSADVVISLTPAQAGGMVRPGSAARLMQKNKKFIPHVVVVTQGTEIEFPNQDLFFHNVFSIHQGKTFDLGLYESGAARKVKFSQPGVSYIFCNIHPQMSAVVVVLRTRYFALTDAEGNFQISHVPPGRYKLAVWYELSPDSELTSQGKEIEVVSGDNAIDRILLHSTDAPPEHPNKDGDPYYSGPSKTR
jgi:plastocyanin